MLRLSNRAARITAVTAFAGASIFGSAIAAHAQTTSTAIPSAGKTPLTQAQRDAASACMAANGFPLPTRPAAGATSTPGSGPAMAQLTDAQRTARDVAATACGLPAGVKGGHGNGDGRGPGGGGNGRPQLTDAQKACLTGNGVTLPAAPGGGSNTTNARPAKPTDAERAARQAAFTACGIAAPTKSGPPTTVKTA